MSSAEHQGPKHLWQFDEFIVDPVRRVLLRQGESVPITPKALSILLVLLERQGEVVTKQELIERIWPDTYVTEANLTQNVSSLRKALGERANERRYLVTVPGRGYSFAGLAARLAIDDEPGDLPALEPPEGPDGVPSTPDLPRSPGSTSGTFRTLAPPASARDSGVFRLPSPAPSSGSPSGARPTLEMEAFPPVPRPAPARRTRPSVWGPVALVLVVLAAAGTLWLAGRGDTPAPSAATPGAPAAVPAVRRSAVAVLGFRNLTEDKGVDWLAPALAEMVTTELAAGSRVRVISGDNVLRARRSLSLPYTDRLGAAEMERLHALLGADLVVVGAYISLGPQDRRQIRLDLRVLRIPAGDTAASLAEVGTEAELFDLVSRTGVELRRALGISGLSPGEERAARALRPADPEAARLYSQGLSRLRAYDPPSARDLLLEAVKVEPGSAVIHDALSQAWSILGYDARAADEAHQALALSGSLAREDRLAMEARLQEANKAWGRSSEIYRTLWTFVPDDLEYGLKLAYSLMRGGHTAEARATLDALRRLPPPAGQDGRIYLLESRVAARLSDFPGEKRAAEAAVAKGRESGEILMVAQGLVLQGGALQSLGRPDEAIRLYRQARQISDNAGFKWVSGMALSQLGVALQSQGDLDAAEKAHTESLAIARELGTVYGMAAQYSTLGLLHRDRGELDEAQRLFEQARSWYVEIGERVMQERVLNAISEVLCARGELTAALRTSETAVAMSRETGSRSNEAEALLVVGAILDLRGDLAEARRYDLQALQIFRQNGETDRAAAALAAVADISARQGDLRGARRRFEHALAARRGAGNRIGTAQILGGLARLSYQSGDLGAARSLSDEQLRLARETGARAVAGQGLQNLGVAQLAMGDLAAARQSLGEALRELTGLGDELGVAAVRLDLARAALAADDPAQALRLARESAAWYEAHGISGGEARSRSLVAEAALRGGELATAREAANRAQAQAAKSADRELRISIATRAARVEAAAGHGEESLRMLREAVREAQESGLVAAALEARLVLGEVQAWRRDPQGAGTLAAVRTEAASHGFELLAQLAAGPPAQRPLG
jgi:DNA-binding winged helix-turn-helix (wHTH) protein/tetratricopeptide (TPR) repeat protein/TolB-like protein